MRLFSILLFLIVALPSPAGPDPKHWIWWYPPKRITKADLSAETTTLGPDRDVITYGFGLAKRNDRLLAHSNKKASIQAIRTDLFTFGMACIALENTFAGGGTYAVHFPKTLYCHVELATYDLLHRARKHPSDAKRIARLRAQAKRYANLPKAPNQLLNDHPAPLADIHFYAQQIQASMERIFKSMAKLDAYQRNAIADTMDYWLFDYLDIRGAVGSTESSNLGTSRNVSLFKIADRD